MSVLIDKSAILEAIKSLEMATLTQSEGKKFNFGAPTKEQLDKINRYLNQPTEASEWYVIPFRASDNLVSRSIRVWHDNVLRQMVKELPGRPLLVDHNWYEVEDSVGFIFDCIYEQSNDCEPEIWDQPGKSEYNREIIRQKGYRCVYALCCVRSDLRSVIEGIESRRLNDCSTGGFLSQIKMICPNCSRQHNREVTFTEKDKYGDYVCPHMIPSQYSQMYAVDDSDDRDYELADYLILNGDFDGIELSIVQAGNLPGACACR